MAAAVHVQQLKMEGSCLELALEGERLCKAGDCGVGVQFLEAAVQTGTDDLKTLSAIYSQLGNAYFYLQEYGKALEYHKHDLNLARTIGDRLGEAKASGNLGNTLKVLGKFDEAIVCCQRHLDISKDLADRIGEARALYNLGNVYHAKGKNAGRGANHDPGDFPPAVKDALQKAAEYYGSNLEIVRELGDRAAQGRACGNLGNTYYLLGEFNLAIKYHEERLAIAKEFGDKSAERRAYSNLGNAHIFLGEFEEAAEYYLKTLQVAKGLNDRALEAQACYSLGNTYTLMREYETAIEYHIQHLKIAMELNDRVGEGRACWSLGNAHTALGNHEKALQYANRHFEISREIGDKTGEATAQMNLYDLKKLLGISDGSDDAGAYEYEEVETDAGVKRPIRMLRRLSMENMQVLKLTPEQKQAQAKQKAAGARPKPPKVQKAATVATELPDKMLKGRPEDKRPISAGRRPQVEMSIDDENFFDQLSRVQSRRIDDQRCSFKLDRKSAENKENKGPKSGSTQADEFLDMVAGIQGSRMNDQRAELPEFPGLTNSREVIAPYMNNRDPPSHLDDAFFEMLMRCQGSRIEEQRSELQPPPSAPTVPDEDFFTLIQRLQSNRIEEQRTALPKIGKSKTKPSSLKKKEKKEK